MLNSFNLFKEVLNESCFRYFINVFPGTIKSKFQLDIQLKIPYILTTPYIFKLILRLKH